MDVKNELLQLDINLLDGYLQGLGVDIVKQMIALYNQQSANYLADIESALLNDDVHLWQEHCHKMKGAAGSVGLKSLYTRLVMMEKSEDSAIEKAQQLAELNIHNQCAITDFNNWVESI